jgi:threonine dehydrogenase-like Zn-dependent dehydrogenase
MLPIETELLQTLVPIPQDKDPQCVVLAEPLACCINALNKFKQLRYNVALVVGAGAVGCLFAALLHAEGFQNVFIADRNPARLEQGVPLHVSTLHVADRPLQAYLKDAGIDGRIDFLAAACEEGLAWPYWEAMNTGGCVSIFSGQATGNALLPIHMNVVHYRELMLAGTYGCNLIDFHSAVRMLVTGSLNLHFLQPHCLPLQAIHTGIAMLEKHQTKKVIFSEF